MKKHRGLSLAMGLAALLGVVVAGEVKAASYKLDVSITDLTTGGSPYTYSILSGSFNNGYSPNSLGISPSNLNSVASGVTLGGITTTTSFGANEQTVLTLGGTAQVNSGSTDTYSVTVTATYSGYNYPSMGPAVLAESESSTLTNTVSSGTVGSTVYNNTQDMSTTFTNGAVPTPGSVGPLTQSIAFPTSSGPISPSATGPMSMGITAGQYVLPYTLTETFNIIITGSSATGANAKDVFGGQATISASAVPEPASLVMMLTGMPLPIVVMQMLRRRRGAKA